MKIYQNPFRCDEHCVPKNTYFFIFYYKIITLLQKCQNIAQIFLFRVSRNCEIFAQISISCLAKFREIRRKFRRNFREITKTKIWKTFSCDSVPLISTHKAYTTCEIALKNWLSDNAVSLVSWCIWNILNQIRKKCKIQINSKKNVWAHTPRGSCVSGIFAI